MPETTFIFAGKKVSIRGYSQSDWIFTSIVNNKTFYEIDLLKYMKFALRKSDGYILDAGANIGNHSIFFGLVMNKKVACFEPNPPIFKILEGNLIANNIDYEAYNVGLGADEGRYSIDDNHEGARSNIGAAKLRETTDGQITVKLLDDMHSKIKFIGEGLAAIKADIEGMEPEMLRGGRATLDRYKPDLFLEISDNHIMKEIEDILYPIGYKKLYAYAGTPVWHFSHTSKLSFMRRIELATYDNLMKIRHYLGEYWRSIKA